MSEAKIENAMVEDAISISRWPRARIGVGFLSAFLLHQAIFAVGALLVNILVNAPGNTTSGQHFHNSSGSMVWLLAWASGAALVWWRAKPTPVEWTPPFALATWFWLLFFCMHADIREEQTGGDLGNGMFFACAMITALGIVRWKLGAGLQQAVSLKRMVGKLVPGFTYQDAPQDILERISSTSEPDPEIAQHPIPSTTEAAMQPLLSNALSENREIDS